MNSSKKRTIDKHLKLADVYLQQKNVRDEGVEYIVKQPLLHIHDLGLETNNITSIGILLLAQAKWGLLTYLNLTQNQIGDKGCLYLSRINSPNLKTLGLVDSFIGNEGILHLSKLPTTHLQYLYLDFNKFSNLIFPYFSKGNWKQLKTITFDNNQIDCEGLKQFMYCGCNNMSYFSASDCQLQEYYQACLKKIMLLKFTVCLQNKILFEFDEQI